MGKNLNEKLIRTEREIAIYKIGADEPINTMNVDSIALNELIQIVPPKEDDPLLYDGYILDQSQLEKINQIKNLGIDADFENYFFVLISTGIYDW